MRVHGVTCLSSNLQIRKGLLYKPLNIKLVRKIGAKESLKNFFFQNLLKGGGAAVNEFIDNEAETKIGAEFFFPRFFSNR